MVAGPITVVQMLPELNAGGVERGTLELGAYLAEEGHISTVISGGGRLVSRLEQEGSRHVSWPIGRKSPFVLNCILPLRRLLVGQQVDILHVRSRLPGWIGYIVWKSLPTHARPSFLTTFHGFYSVNRYSAVMAKGERVIANSKEVANHIMKVYRVPEDRIVVIYRGVDERIFNPVRVSEDRVQRIEDLWQLNKGQLNDGRLNRGMAPVIMLPGRFTAWKGQDIFIQSLSRLKALPWMAVCVGDLEEHPSYTKRLQRLIVQERLENRIRLVGYCDDMPAAYKLSDVVVSASSTEPEAFGRVAVEAQAMGKPIIATAHGGSLETVIEGKTGWLVKPCDVEDLAKALHKAIQDRTSRNNLGRKGREWVLENFTVQRMCRETVSLYHRMIREKNLRLGSG